MLKQMVRDGLLAIGVMCGPGLCLVAIACAYSAWLPGLEDAARLELLYASFVLGCWALWGIVTGPWRLRHWWFGLASSLNIATGSYLVMSDRPNGVPVGAVFLAYSLWQFFVFRRPDPKRRDSEA